MAEDIRLDCLRAAQAAACRIHRGRMAAERWLAAEQRIQHLVALGRRASGTRVTRTGGSGDEIVLTARGDGDAELDSAIRAAQDACAAYRATQAQAEDWRSAPVYPY